MTITPPTTVSVRYIVHDVDAAIHEASRLHCAHKCRACVRRRNAWFAAAIAKRANKFSRAADALMALAPKPVQRDPQWPVLCRTFSPLLPSRMAPAFRFQPGRKSNGSPSCRVRVSWSQLFQPS